MMVGVSSIDMIRKVLAADYAIKGKALLAARFDTIVISKLVNWDSLLGGVFFFFFLVGV